MQQDAENRPGSRDFLTPVNDRGEFPDNIDPFRIAFDYAVTGIALVTPEGRYLHVNAALCAILGYSAQELLQTTFQALTYRDDLAMTHAYADRVLAGELSSYQIEKRYVHKDGHIVWALVSVALLRNVDGKPVYFIAQIQDITTRKQAEAATQDSEARFRLLFEHSPDAIFLIDPHGPDGQWCIVDCNTAACRMNGYARDELIGHDIHMLSTTPWDPVGRMGYLEQLRRRGVAHSTSIHRRKDGTPVPVAFSSSFVTVGNRELILGIDRDVTEQRLAEAAQARRARYSALRADVSTAFTGRVPLRASLQQCAEALIRQLDAAVVRIWLLGDVDNPFLLEASAGTNSDLDARIPVGELLLRRIAQLRQPYVSDDVAGDPFIEDKDWARREGLVGFAGYPLLVDDRLVGLMGLFTRQSLPVDMLDALASIAVILGQGIERKRAEEALQLAKDELERRVRERTTEVLAVNRQLRVELAQRERAERHLAVQYDVSRVLAAAADFEVAGPRLLRIICESLQWQLAQLWHVDSAADVLRWSAAWSASDAAASEFVSASRQTTFQRGAGLPGTAWARREPVWLDDVSGQLNFPRLAYAVRAGWQSAVAFAIRGGGEVFAVMEFFSVEPRPADEELIHVVGTMSNQIDQFVERWQAEGAVRAGELRTRAILEAALDCIVTMDHVGRVVEWNPAAERTFGWGRGEALGQEMAELIIPLSLRDAHRQGLARYLASGEGAVIGKRIELVAMRRDGSEFPVELAITPIPAEGPPLFTGFIRDITERKRVEAAERDARAEAEASTRMLQRVQTIADVALAHYALDDLLRELLSRVCEILAGDTAVILLLDPDGRELHVRAALGLEEELATAVTIPVGRGVAGRIAAQGAPLIVQDLSTVEVIMPALRSAGIRSLVGAPLHVEGRVIGVIHVGVRQPHQYTDEDARLLQMVADRAALAIDHARLYQEAQEGVRLRDEFLSIASHELKTPITSLLAYTQLLARRLDQQRGVSERDRRAVQVIGEQAERLARLIAALLDLSRIETGHFPIERRRMDLVRLLGRIVDEVRPTLKQHTLAFDSAVKALQIDGDELRLEQVFRNLLQNAIKYSPSGGPIGVHIEPRDDRAAIYVRDQGVGIPEAARERLFHRFFRASNIAGSNISGFGIGLYIVCEIVSRHGGTVEVMSEEGKGSTFVVRLPLRGPAENT